MVYQVKCVQRLVLNNVALHFNGVIGLAKVDLNELNKILLLTSCASIKMVKNPTAENVIQFMVRRDVYGGFEERREILDLEFWFWQHKARLLHSIERTYWLGILCILLLVAV